MLKALLRDSVVYGIANAIQKLVPFLLVPLIIRNLGQAALTLYDVSFVYAYLFSWLIVLGQDSAASVFYFDEVKTRFDKRQVLAYGLLIQLFFLTFAALLFWPFRHNIAHTLFPTDLKLAGWWLVALSIVPGHIMLNYTLNILLWTGRKKEYVFLCLCQTLFSLSFVYSSLILWNGSVASLFYSLVGSTTLCGLIGMLLTRHTMQVFPFSLNKRLLRKLLWFGLPFAFTAFLHQALPSLDRWFLLHYQQPDLPQYIVAVKLGGLAGMAISAFALAFTPYSLATLNNQNAARELSSLFRAVAIISLLAVPAALLFKGWLVQAFAGESFSVSEKLLPFFFFGWVFDLFSYFSLLGIYKAQNSFLMLIFFAAGISVLAALNALLIPHWGVYGAAGAFAFTKAFLFFATLFVLRRHFKLSVHWPSFLLAGLAAVLCCYLIYQTTAVAGTAALLVAATVAAYYLSRQQPLRLLVKKNHLQEAK